MHDPKDEGGKLVDSIVENIPDMIFVKDAEHLRFVRFNRAGEVLLGIPRDEMYGKSDYDFFPKDEADFFTAKDREVLAGGKPVDILEEPLHTQHGERWLHTRKVPILGEDGVPRYLLGISTDITERRNAQRALAEAEARLHQQEQEALEAKLREAQRLEGLGVMAGGIAHDFNNLLVSILGNVSLARAQLTGESPAGELLEHIQAAAEQAAELTRHMLAYAGGGQLLLEPLDLRELVNELVALLGLNTRQTVTLDIDIDSDLPSFRGDGTQLRQLVMNLLTNAIEATEIEGGEVRLRAEQVVMDQQTLDTQWPSSELAAGEYLLLDVRDNGCGMDDATRFRVFDPFFTTKETGHGLGLAAVHGIVKGHKGGIEVDSEPGQGSRFRVLLPMPAHLAEEGDPRVEVQQCTSNEGAIQTGLALVVDDQQQVRQFARAALEFMGFEVLEAQSGPDAIRLFEARQEDVELVLLDMTLPGMNGDEILPIIRRMRSGVPVVISSGHLQNHILESIELDEHIAFLQKPYRIQELERVIASVRSGGK